MALRSPNLDDRSFDQLLEIARQRVQQIAPEWDLSPSDPGMVLLDVFAHLTEVLIYRFNQIPVKAYIEFLNLLGVRLQPPMAASVKLVFRRLRPGDAEITISRGTRVTVARTASSGEQPVFTTARTVRIEKGQNEAESLAYNADLIEAEMAGTGTGLARLSVNLRRPPVVAATTEDLELVVAVEAGRDRLDERVRALRHGDKSYRVWQEVDSFAMLARETPAYVVDRISGIVSFAPSVRLQTESGELEHLPQALASIPEKDRQILVWYWRGGGDAGNVAANTLTVLQSAVAGVSVTNPERASGGRPAESLDNALIRGPNEFRSLERAVTARDFEMLANRHGAVSRVRAVTRADIWKHAVPGTVELLLVPEVPSERYSAPLDAAGIIAFQTDAARQQIQEMIDDRMPLAAIGVVNWAHCKTVCVRSRITAYREEDEDALRQRVLQRLYRTINPAKWDFGMPLRASRVYDLILAEPGVNYVEDVSFKVDDVPQKDVSCITRDAFQENTWHVGSAGSVFRTMNDGDGWERTVTFPGETVRTIAAHPDVPGLLAAATSSVDDADHSGLYFSQDDGETWSAQTTTNFSISALAWTKRNNTPLLFLATAVGLYQVSLDDLRAVVQVLVDAATPQLGFTAVTTITGVRGEISVAAAAQENAGVFLSAEGGRSGTFRNIGLPDPAIRDSIRVLAHQYDGPNAFLWAGYGAAAGAAGYGAARIELIGSEISPANWRRYAKGWMGGSCTSLAFAGPQLYAGSYQAGVLKIVTSRPEAEWVVPDITSGLPQRERDRIFHPINSVAATSASDVVLCGGRAGVYRSADQGVSWSEVSSPIYENRVMLPPTWLFCSGEHSIEVVEDREND